MAFPGDKDLSPVFVAPSISSILSSIGSFFGSSFTLGSLVTARGEAAISLNGAQIFGVVVAVANILFFASDHRQKITRHKTNNFGMPLERLDITLMILVYGTN